MTSRPGSGSGCAPTIFGSAGGAGAASQTLRALRSRCTGVGGTPTQLQPSTQVVADVPVFDDQVVPQAPPTGSGPPGKFCGWVQDTWDGPAAVEQDETPRVPQWAYRGGASGTRRVDGVVESDETLDGLVDQVV